MQESEFYRRKTGLRKALAAAVVVFCLALPPGGVRKGGKGDRTSCCSTDRDGGGDRGAGNEGG